MAVSWMYPEEKKRRAKETVRQEYERKIRERQLYVPGFEPRAELKQVDIFEAIKATESDKD